MYSRQASIAEAGEEPWYLFKIGFYIQMWVLINTKYAYTFNCTLQRRSLKSYTLKAPHKYLTYQMQLPILPYFLGIYLHQVKVVGVGREQLKWHMQLSV